MKLDKRVKGISLAAQCLLEVGKDFKVTNNSEQNFLSKIYCTIKEYLYHRKEEDKPNEL